MIVMRSGLYRDVRYRAGLTAAAAVLTTLLTVEAAWLPWGWHAANAAWLMLATLIAYGIGYRLGGLDPIIRLFTPADRMRHKVKLRAERAFAQHGLSRTRDRNGVLIFLGRFEAAVASFFVKGEVQENNLVLGQAEGLGGIAQFSATGPTTLFVTPSGRAAISRGFASSTFVTGVGSGSALVDLVGDNVPEVLATQFKTNAGDEARVMTLKEFEAAQARNLNLAEVPTLWRDKLAGRAVVAAAGRECVVLGLWKDDGTGELVMIRREK